AVVVEPVAERLGGLVVASVARDAGARDPARDASAGAHAPRADAELERAGGRRQIARLIDRAVAVVVDPIAHLAHRADGAGARAPCAIHAGLRPFHARADVGAARLRVA